MKTLNLNSHEHNQVLYGREDELQHLQSVWRQLLDSHGKRKSRRVLIRGYAGIGKTKLITTFLERIREPHQVLIGKFEEQHNDNSMGTAAPCSALADAISKWCQEKLDTQSGEQLLTLQRQIRAAVGDQVQALLQAIPTLTAFLTEETKTRDDNHRHHANTGASRGPPSSSTSTSKSRVQLEYQLLRIIKNVISNQDQVGPPLILWLDDLQWASDDASLDVFRGLLMDTHGANMLLIGSYRDEQHLPSSTPNRVTTSHPHLEMLQQIQTQGIPVLSLQLGNLELVDTQHYIAQVLQLETDQVEALAEAIHTKTHGNIYFTRASLLLLEQRQILQYSYNTYRWMWDLHRLQSEMGISRNVVDLTLASLQLLPHDVQHALSVAALGFSRSLFDLETLQLLLEAVGSSNDSRSVDDDKSTTTITKDNNSNKQTQLQDRLEIAVTQGFLENPVGTKVYRFVHDRIREGAFCIWDQYDSDKKGEAMIRIGKKLLDLSRDDVDNNNKTEEDWMIFAGLDNLNSAEVGIDDILVQTGMSRRDLVQWNFKAGSVAVQRSTFASASVYLQKALELVSTIDERWNKHDPRNTKNDDRDKKTLYHTCLELYVVAANVDFCLGKSDRAQSTLQQVIDKAHSERDKLPAYMALAEGLGQKGRHAGALEIDRKAMAILNPSFPRWFLPVHLLGDIKFLKTTFQKKSDEDLLALPVLDNDSDDRVLAMNILSQMWIRAYLSQQVVTSLLCMTRALRMTLEHGLSPPGALAFAAYGSLLCGPLADYKLGVRLGFLAHKMLHLTNGVEFESRVLFTAAAHTDAWDQPLSEVQNTLHRGFKAGLEVGDTEFAAFNIQYHNIHAYMMGLPLDPIIEESERLMVLLNQHEVESVRCIVLPFHQMLLDFAGKTTDPMAWVRASEIGDRQRRKPSKKKDLSENIKLIWSYLSRGQLAYFFARDEPELADQIWTRLKPLLAGMSSFSAPSMEIFFSGLIACAMYRKTGGKRKYRAQAQKAVKEMKGLIETHGMGINLLHRYYIMKAEFEASCEKATSKDDIRKPFDQAISVSSKGGFLQDASLAHELCGQHFVDRDEIYWAKHYLTAAYNLYADWGAKAKAEHLSKTRSAFVDHKTSARTRMSVMKKGPLSSRSISIELLSLDKVDKLDNSTTTHDETSDGRTINS